MFKHPTRIRGTLRALPVAAVALAALGTQPAGAVATGDAGYMTYHQSIQAAVLCEGYKLKFGSPMVMGATSDSDFLPLWTPERQKQAEADMTIIESMVVQQAGPTLSNDRLPMIEQAKAHTGDMVREDGCASPEVAGLLDLFHSDLMPAKTEG